MVEVIIGFLVFVPIIVLVVWKIGTPRSNRRKSLKNDPIPDQLGIQIEGGLPIVQGLDKALSTSYVDNVRNRVLRERPKLADHEFEWLFFELKRYFIMNSLLKSVPMFSESVDEFWHEMLMFTREYEKFTKDFYNDKLHHAPNLDSTPIPGERAFFDWVYLSLFQTTSNSRNVWGSFLQNPIKREILDDFRILSEEELLTKYFRSNDEWVEVKRNLITKMKSEINESEQMKLGNKKFAAPSSITDTQIYTYALGAAVFYSLYEEDQFQDQMSELIPDEYHKAGYAGGGSSCSGFACSSDHDSGGDSGGSSCSTCGGGCSS